MRILFNDNWKLFINERFYGEVTLPFDAMLVSPRSPDAPSGSSCAYFEGGFYVYEKEFLVPKEWEGKSIEIDFGGVYRKATVYLNGKEIGKHEYGYTGFRLPLEGIRIGQTNEIKVTADNRACPNSRWYTGGGIYRDVNLIVRNPLHFESCSITVKTLGINPAKIKIESKYPTGVAPIYEIYDGDVLVAKGKEEEFVLENAKLWDDESPNLYTLKARLMKGEEEVDSESISFGIRELKFTTSGLFVNGKKTLLRGGCVHHDNGIIGSAAIKEAEYRKIRLLKEAGFNAIRCAHNPCSDHLLDACDKYGVYVMDEGFDMWFNRKRKYDYALDFMDNYESDLTWMATRDKNHPSVIMYSIGNEIGEPGSEKGVRLAKKMIDLLHKVDPTRPVTAGANLMIIANAAKGKGIYDEKEAEEAERKNREAKPVSSTQFNMIAMKLGPSMNKMVGDEATDIVCSPFIDLLDVCGYNYANSKYVYDAEHHPERVIVGSETFAQDVYRNWRLIEQYPAVIGDFMWTAIDYLGEAGIGGWHYGKNLGYGLEKPYPWIIADSGAIDIVGMHTAEMVYAQVAWGLRNTPAITVMPANEDYKVVNKSSWRGSNAIESWAWRGCIGNEVQVEVYGESAFVELYINNRKIGRRTVKDGKAIFRCAYEEGTVEAVALNEKKKETSRSELHSSTGDLQVSLISDRVDIKRGEVAFIEVNLEDEDGIRECNRDIVLEAQTDGELLGFGSAEQIPTEPYYTSKCKTHYGVALLAVRAKRDGVSVIVTGDGLKGEIEI